MANLDVALALDGGKADEIQGEMADDWEVTRGIARPCSHLIIAKGDIHAPV